jgi:hypothetical protein
MERLIPFQSEDYRDSLVWRLQVFMTEMPFKPVASGILMRYQMECETVVMSSMFEFLMDPIE